MNNYRLTVHVLNAKKSRVETGKMIKTANGKMIPETKEKIFNTLSSYHKTKDACMQALSSIRVKYDIAIGKDYENKSKLGKELYNISFVN
jgi:hypothetical protein